MEGSLSPQPPPGDDKQTERKNRGVSKGEITMAEDTYIFCTMAQQGGVVPTYKTFKNKGFRESFNFPKKIWNEFKSLIKNIIMAKVISYTGKYASFIVYEPKNTTSGRVPILTAIIKVFSSSIGNLPTPLKLYEAPIMEDSPIILILEYQVREHG